MPLYWFGRRFREGLLDEIAALDAQRAPAPASLPELERRVDALWFEYRTKLAHRRAPSLAAELDRRLDVALYTQQPERMDLGEPTLERHLRNIASLDKVNDTLRSYALFSRLVRRFVDERLPARGESTTLRILDLASGHGGFPLFLDRHARRHGWNWQITGSDYDRNYVAKAQERARIAGQNVAFVELDALQMAGLASGDYDLIVCTQSIHHFRPGQLARMMRESSRVARHGWVLVDSIRGFFFAAAVAGFIGALTRNPDTIHDGWISLRKMFFPEELRFLARMAGLDAPDTTMHPPLFVRCAWSANDAR
ncbi:MAG: methyltransferase domain-containing protein [Myxococcales bacterium]|nr:methyltransferase domain-containing protein [Myxococcales bacterium]